MCPYIPYCLIWGAETECQTQIQLCEERTILLLLAGGAQKEGRCKEFLVHSPAVAFPRVYLNHLGDVNGQDHK